MTNLDNVSAQLVRTGSEPLYKQLKQILFEQVKISENGDPLPTEDNLCEIFSVSRQTVRQALSELVTEGHIVRHPRRGSFVRKRKVTRDTRWALTDFNRELRRHGLEPETRVLKNQITAATDLVAGKLEVEEGAPVICIERLRFADGWPLVVSISYLPHDRVPGLEQRADDLERESLHVIIEGTYGFSFQRAERSVEAVPAQPQKAELLQIAAESPILYSQTLWSVDAGFPLEYVHEWYRGDRSRFTMCLDKESLDVRL